MGWWAEGWKQTPAGAILHRREMWQVTPESAERSEPILILGATLEEEVPAPVTPRAEESDLPRRLGEAKDKRAMMTVDPAFQLMPRWCCRLTPMGCNQPSVAALSENECPFLRPPHVFSRRAPRLAAGRPAQPGRPPGRRLSLPAQLTRRGRAIWPRGPSGCGCGFAAPRLHGLTPRGRGGGPAGLIRRAAPLLPEADLAAGPGPCPSYGQPPRARRVAPHLRRPPDDVRTRLAVIYATSKSEPPRKCGSFLPIPHLPVGPRAALAPYELGLMKWPCELFYFKVLRLTARPCRV